MMRTPDELLQATRDSRSSSAVAACVSSRRWLIIYFLPVVVLLIAGCDTMNWQQYRIAGVAAGSPDATKLRATLQTVADQSGLKDRTQDSRERATFAFFTQPDVRNFRVDIGARFTNGDVLVDLVSSFGPTPTAFKQAKKLLAPALSAEFSSRVSVPQPFVPIK